MTTTDLPERFDLASEVPRDDRFAAIRAAFPEALREGKIDFDALRRSLGDWVEPGPERFGLTWPGKAECMRVIQEPSIGTLVPMPDDSVDWDTTENVIIEGDNLEVLKLLQKAYYGKVKLIYIDPPYNTGKEFIYPDNFREGLADYLRYSGQTDEEGMKLTANAETDGRYHSKWLSMMYPRLFLARNLLAGDGLLFVSIGDQELHNLRSLLNEIFGEENFIAQIVWKKSYGGGAKTKYVVGQHEYVVCVARNKEAIKKLELPPNPDVLKYYKYRDARFDTRGPYRTQPLATTSMAARPNLRFPIPWKGEEIWPEKQWQWSRDRVTKAIANDELVIKRTKDGWSVDYKQYLRDEDGEERAAKPFSIIDGPYTQQGTDDLDELGLKDSGFTFPKPVGLICQLLQYGGKDDIVMDFFAGSGTLAQSVFELNHSDDGSRKFVLVQLPEPVDVEGYASIAAITRERVRRASAATAALQEPLGSRADLGFRAFRLSTSNFLAWDASSSSAEALEDQLELSVEHIADGATEDSLLTELLLKAGYPLTSRIETADFAGTTGYSVADGALVVCLSRALSIEAFEAMVEREPAMVVVLDAGFGESDELKVNALQTVRARNQQSGSDIMLRVV